jgi:hypothetical protein
LPKPYPLHFNGGSSAFAQNLTDQDDLRAALDDLAAPRPVLVLVGGADGLDSGVARRVGTMFRDSLAPLLDRLGAAVIDGGTDSGVMAQIGGARARAGASFPLIGVAPRGTVRPPGSPPLQDPKGTPLEPNHTRFLLVPGDRWGDESSWIGAAATTLAKGAPSATLAVGGGKVTRLDLEQSLRAGRQTLLLAGSGGTTDNLVRAIRAHGLGALGIDGRGAGLLQVVDLGSACTAIDRLLRDPSSS